jgi:site-specific recombinase XerD
MNIELVTQHFCEYSKFMRGFSPSTIRRYRQAIKYYLRFANITTFDQVSSVTIRKMFFTGRMVSNWKPATFISYQKSLSVFFEWCMKEGYLKENPIADLESPKLERHLPTKLTKQEAYKLLEAVYNYPYESSFIRHRNHAIFATLIFAGLRKREILKLRYADVDLENLTLFIFEGKGRKDRVIPMSQGLAISLSRYVAERKKHKITCPEFFASSIVNRGVSETTLKRMVDSFRTSTKIKFTLHKLRHTFATLMIEGGCDIYSLSKMMGHEDIRTTTLYLNATIEHLKSQMIKHPLNTPSRPGF